MPNPSVKSPWPLEHWSLYKLHSKVKKSEIPKVVIFAKAPVPQPPAMVECTPSVVLAPIWRAECIGQLCLSIGLQQLPELSFQSQKKRNSHPDHHFACSSPPTSTCLEYPIYTPRTYLTCWIHTWNRLGNWSTAAHITFIPKSKKAKFPWDQHQIIHLPAHQHIKNRFRIHA